MIAALVKGRRLMLVRRFGDAEQVFAEALDLRSSQSLLGDPYILAQFALGRHGNVDV